MKPGFQTVDNRLSGLRRRTRCITSCVLAPRGDTDIPLHLVEDVYGEILKLLGDFDAGWSEGPEWSGPQGRVLRGEELRAYPLLFRFFDGVTLRAFETRPESGWICVGPAGGAMGRGDRCE